MFIIELYGTWEGRIGRAVHALGFIALLIVSVIIHVMLANVGGPAVQGLFGLMMCYPFWMLAIKRAHDLNKSGWWVLGWSLSSLVSIALVAAGLFATKAGSHGLGLTLCAVSFLLSLIAFWNTFIKMFFFAGSPGSNSFGPPPRLAAQLLNSEDDAPGAIGGLAMTQRVATPRAAQAAMRPELPRTPQPASRGLRQAQPAMRAPGGFGRRGIGTA